MYVKRGTSVIIYVGAGALKLRYWLGAQNFTLIEILILQYTRMQNSNDKK